MIIFGGNSFEHEISCKSVNNVFKSIDKNKYNVDLVGINKKNSWFLINNYSIIDEKWEKLEKIEVKNIIEFLKKYDTVFPVMHGAYGEDGKIQALFELFNINYIGSSCTSSINDMDKYLTKLI